VTGALAEKTVCIRALPVFEGKRRHRKFPFIRASGVGADCFLRESPVTSLGATGDRMSKPPPTFSIGFERLGFLSWRLTARQLLPLPPKETFVFFRDPRNLSSLIPDWLSFTLAGPPENPAVYEGAEFDYTIRWFGLRLTWRSRIVDYRPPERFTDVQVVGPYRFWRHLHTFDPVPEGTLLGEEVVYRIPVEAALAERLINRQLEEIFTYRAARLAAWAASAKIPQ